MESFTGLLAFSDDRDANNLVMLYFIMLYYLASAD